MTRQSRMKVNSKHPRSNEVLERERRAGQRPDHRLWVMRRNMTVDQIGQRTCESDHQKHGKVVAAVTRLHQW
jgi:hypothetical protein